ncbi:hypothetical protein HJG60_010742 [Phyllostomus discolor]|uniref:Uncharacterized protein n=1 Tax=Phyllostomus discolor TaxID=89673 RepID=A0A834A6K4_9CHIR|nr:hypothetical protein HJG60_010742 [Phyllostomus discolor]
MNRGHRLLPREIVRDYPCVCPVQPQGHSGGHGVFPAVLRGAACVRDGTFCRRSGHRGGERRDAGSLQEQRPALAEHHTPPLPRKPPGAAFSHELRSWPCSSAKRRALGLGGEPTVRHPSDLQSWAVTGGRRCVEPLRCGRCQGSRRKRAQCECAKHTDACPLGLAAFAVCACRGTQWGR